MWFWSTQIPAKFYKRFLILLAFCLSAFILWMGVMEYSTRVLKERIVEVEKLLKTQIGFPIQYSAIEPEWRLGAIVLSLKDVILIDNEVPIPFLSAKTLQLVTNPYRLIFKQEQPFNQLRLDGMRMIIGWDIGKELSILGLKGEWFTSSFDYQSLLKALSSQDKIRFHNAEILWQGPNTSITQRIDGKLLWDDINTLSWNFSGKQQIKVNNKGDFWPVSFFSLQMNTPAKQLNLKAGIERTRLDLKLDFPKNNNSNDNSENTASNHIESKGKGKNDSKSEAKPKQTEPIYVEAAIEGRDIDLRVLHQNVMVSETDPEWLRWLIGALERGSLTRGKVNILGPFNNLDWNGEIDFHNVNLQYNKDWPKIRKADGKVFIQKDKVKVEVVSGNILGSPLKRVDALIEPMDQADVSPILRIEGALNGRLENGIKFLLLSPLKDTIGQHLSHLKPTGLMELHLNLIIPLGNSKAKTEVQGQIGIEKGQVILDALELPMTHLTGLFRFTEKGVEAKGVTAKLLDKPVQIEANPSRVTATLEVNSEFLQEKFETPLLSYLNGESEMSVSYLSEGGWMIESSLQGMSIDLPYPFAKKADAIQPLALSILPPDGKESYYALAVKDRVNAKWTIETNEEESVLKRGQIVLGGTKDAEWTKNNILYISGTMPYLNVEEWKSFLDKGPALTQQLSIQINILAAELEAFGINFKNTAIKHLSDNTAAWSLDGPTIKGSLYLPTSKNKQLQFAFQYLKLNANQIDNENNNSKALIKDHDRIPISFTAENLTYEDAWFGETSFRLLPKPYGYEIQELIIKNKASRLDASGEWRMTEGTETSHLVGELLSDNMSQTFAQWGFSSAMQEGKGRIQFNLQWPGSPFQVSLKKVEGAADLKLRSGHILGMNSGLGKILGLLSLENLVKRSLKLDFSDVANKGFGFDKLETSMSFKNGMLSTDNLFIDGPAAKIKISGQANLSSKELDLQMLVTPKASNTLPITATLLTGNPGIGVGVWVLDKLSGSGVSKIFQRRYHVTGTWDEPQMNEEGKIRNARPQRKEKN